MTPTLQPVICDDQIRDCSKLRPGQLVVMVENDTEKLWVFKKWQSDGTLMLHTPDKRHTRYFTPWQLGFEADHLGRWIKYRYLKIAPQQEESPWLEKLKRFLNQ